MKPLAAVLALAFALAVPALGLAQTHRKSLKKMANIEKMEPAPNGSVADDKPGKAPAKTRRAKAAGKVAPKAVTPQVSPYDKPKAAPKAVTPQVSPYDKPKAKATR